MSSTIFCSTLDAIGSVFESHFKSNDSVWIASHNLEFLRNKITSKHFKEVRGVPSVFFSFKETKVSKTLRRALAVYVAGVGTLATLPVWAFCSFVIPLESEGPVFYVDKRAGKDGLPINFIKFRTMKKDDKEDANRLSLRELAFKMNGKQKAKNDPRITRFGAFLRRRSIDELPQLLHVLEGTVDLVGPRAYKLDETNLMSDWQKKRLLDKPGITGFWQTSGRSDTTFNDSILMDMYYLANRNIILDLKYTLKTPLVMVSCKGSY